MTRATLDQFNKHGFSVTRATCQATSSRARNACATCSATIVIHTIAHPTIEHPRKSSCTKMFPRTCHLQILTDQCLHRCSILIETVLHSQVWYSPLIQQWTLIIALGLRILKPTWLLRWVSFQGNQDLVCRVRLLVSLNSSWMYFNNKSRRLRQH